MPEENVAPLAVVLPPSTMPYQFTELANPRGDFDALVAPGETVNPKGMAYHPQLDALLLSLSPFRIQLDQRVQVMNRMERNGNRARFADGYTMYRAVESKIAIAPPNEFVVAAGFTPGEVFVGRGPTTQISRLSADGAVLDDVFSEFGNGSVWGALAFDTEGLFGGKLIAVEANGSLMLIDAQGQAERFGKIEMRLEGAAIAPATFGPFAKHLLVGVEGYGDQDPHGGKIFAVNADGASVLLANIGFAAEDLSFVPPRGGTYYQTQLSFERERDNRILSVSASQFLKRSSFSLILVSRFGKPSWCASPILVKSPMSGSRMGASFSISPGSEMPASKMPSVCSDVICSTDSGTPVCELKLLGLRTT